MFSQVQNKKNVEIITNFLHLKSKGYILVHRHNYSVPIPNIFLDIALDTEACVLAMLRYKVDE